MSGQMIEAASYLLIFGVIIVVLSLPLGLLMMFVTTYYLNNSTRRARLIELVWGKENEYYRGKKMDWVMCNYVFSGATFTAWRFKKGYWITKKQKQVGSYGYPMLHRDKNYLKLLDEFPFFVRWEVSKMILLSTWLIASIIYYFVAK